MTPSLISLIQLLTFISLSFSYPHSVFNGYQIDDLRFKGGADFDMEVESWTAVGLVDSTVKRKPCFSDPLVGGINVLNTGGYYEKTFDNLPPHDMIYFRLRLGIIDNWQGEDTVILQFDDKNVSAGTIALDRPAFSIDICGNSYKDKEEIYFMGKVEHTSNSVRFRIISDIQRSPTIASFMFRKINLNFVNKSSGETEMHCALSDVVIPYNYCGCPMTYYMNPLNNSQCLSCDPSCAECFGPGSNQCYTCSTYGYSYNGTNCIKCATGCVDCFGPGSNQCLKCSSGRWHKWDYTCPSTCDSPTYSQQTISTVKLCKVPCLATEFFLWNQTCNSSCDAPYIQRTNNFGQFCDWPCSSSEFLDWNNICQPTCEPPLIQVNESGFYSCKLPCCSNGEFLYPNGSCISSCVSPFIQSTNNSVDVCNYPCDFANGELLYWNGTCISSCTSPSYTRTETDFKYCDACQPGYFRYTLNDTCIPSCPSPLIQRNVNLSQFCDPPCSIIESAFLYPNGACQTSCDLYPAEDPIYGFSNCVYPCPDPQEYFYELNETCSSTCELPYTPYQDTYRKCILASQKQTVMNTVIAATGVGGDLMDVGMALATVISGTNPGSVGLGSFIKMLPYIRYMEITYPPRLQTLLDNLNSTILTFMFGPTINPVIQNQFTKYPLPAKFDKYGLHSSFMVNYWQVMTTLAIALGVILFLVVLTQYTRRWPQVHVLFTRLTVIVKWNFFLMIFCNNLDSVILGTSLELRTLEFNSVPAVLSFIFCITINVLMILILALIVYIIYDLRKHQHPIFAKQSMRIKKKWEEYQMFYKGSREDLMIRHIFLFPFLLRICIFYAIISYMFKYPLVQISIIVTMDIIMLMYMLTVKPFVSKIVFAQCVSDEIILTTVNISILILAIFDNYGINNATSRIEIGDLVIILNVVINFSANLFLAIYVYVGMKNAIIAMRSKKTRSILPWLLILLSPFEFGGMDMDLEASDDTEKARQKSNHKAKKTTKVTPIHIEQSGTPKENSKSQILSFTGLERRGSAQQYFMDIFGSPSSKDASIQSIDSINVKFISSASVRRDSFQRSVHRILRHSGHDGLDSIYESEQETQNNQADNGENKAEKKLKGLIKTVVSPAQESPASFSMKTRKLLNLKSGSRSGSNMETTGIPSIIVSPSETEDGKGGKVRKSLRRDSSEEGFSSALSDAEGEVWKSKKRSMRRMFIRADEP